MVGTSPGLLVVVAAPEGEGTAVDVELHFHGVGELYQRFFSDPSAVGALGRALGPCLNETAQVVVSYDGERRIGRIRLRVPPGGASCMPAEADGAYSLRPIQPIGAALAAYRDALAASFDLRIQSFEIGLQLTRGTHTCVLRAAGDHPPSGSLWSPCVGMAGDKCAAGEAGVATLSFADGADMAYARKCFSSP